jgi:hypothetical protein
MCTAEVATTKLIFLCWPLYAWIPLCQNISCLARSHS